MDTSMKRILLLSALLAFVPLAPAIATQSPDTKPEIITDPKTNTVRIMIDGKEVVRIDANGLHVTGDLTYTGVESDVGTTQAEPRK
jgi:hypothetical protein